MRITEKIVWDFNGKIIEHQFYEYTGSVALCGGPSGGEKAAAAQLGVMTQELMNNYATVFGESSNIFSTLSTSFSPIVAAGPNQEGFTQDEWNSRQAAIKEQAGETITHAEAAAADRIASQGGIMPSGARESLLSKIETAGKAEESKEMSMLRAEDYATGRQKWLEATKGLMGTPGVMTPSTQLGEAATKAGAESFQAQEKMAEQSSSWMGVVGGILGKVAGGAMEMAR